jgi:hypothetical protein
MGGVVNLREGDEMVLQNFFICLGIHCGVFRQNIEAPTTSAEKQPQTMMESGCLRVFTMNLIL